MGKPPNLDGYSQVVQERKTDTVADFVDEEYPITITSVISTTQYELADVSNVLVDMTIVQDLNPRIISSIDGNIITVTKPSDYTIGDGYVYQPIFNKVTWNPIDCENSGVSKQHQDIKFIFKKVGFTSIDVVYSSDWDPGEVRHALINNAPAYGWGGSPWGLFPWGLSAGATASLHDYVSRQHQYCTMLNVSLELHEAFTGFALLGLSIMFRPLGSRQK
jgi:hypothetical protein